ncbi:MAG: Tex family protein [Pseudomonadota bacterium]
MNAINQQIANELSVNPRQVEAAVSLLDEGSTVPFIARYRKEATGGLDDTQLRGLEERLQYLRELEERREVILKSIRDQEKLTPELEKQIQVADTKTALEDLYLPYKPKRRTKGQIAIEAGLEPLADKLFAEPSLEPETLAQEFINTEHKIDDVKAALDGAKYILMERFSENAQLLGQLRDYLWENGLVTSKLTEGKEKEGAKFSDYFDYSEVLKDIPSHRALALFRGRNESILQLQLLSSTQQLEDPKATSPCQPMIAAHFGIKDEGRPADTWLQQVVQWTWKIKLSLHIENELFAKLREQSELEAITVFAKNLKDLLMAAPAGKKITIGLDPGLRTGVKTVVVDDTGKFLFQCTIFPHAPQNQWDQSINKLKTLCTQFNVELIAIGNGTASRETDKLVNELQKKHPELKVDKLVVSEAGASVYSASELAAKEFPDLDVSLRGAVSIARRLQDPLAELVKIEPKSIGVGQYQHDVSQVRLAKSLDAVIEDCVNAVGVDVNTASAPLLSRVSGLNKTLANNIVKYRDEHGRFGNRETLKEVPRMGDKTFEQSAGFLRIMGGENPLDASAVHPEAYQLVENIQSGLELTEVSKMIGNGDILKNIQPVDYANEQFGEPTIKDILNELEKPGRDPRPEFKTAKFKEGVEKVSDLSIGMKLEGVITNVTNFGAFVDVGVHQDGLVHISALADKFVKDPREVVKTGEIVKVTVIEVDVDRKRIGLSMRADALREAGSNPSAKPNTNKPQNRKQNRNAKPRRSPATANHGRKHQAPINSAFADALSSALKQK